MKAFELPKPAKPEVTVPDRPRDKPQAGEPGLHPSVAALQGKMIRKISVMKQETAGRFSPLSDEITGGVIRSLTTRAGKPLDVRTVTLDINNLWNERRLVMAAYAIEDGSEVELMFGVIREDRIYERLEWKGLVHLDRREVDDLLGLYADRPVSTSEAEAMRNVLIARYRRDGYAWCSILLKESDPEPPAPGEKVRKVLTFRIDEGPKVTIGKLAFRGHRSYAVSPFLGFIGSGDYLIRDAHIQSDPAGSFLFFRTSGDPFSREVIEEDMVRLRLFYRSRGFLDALVELADARFSKDHTEVDLDILVVEGQRYRIRSVGLQREDNLAKVVPESQARYPAAEVMAILKVKAGDYYDQDAIARDRRALYDFYGARGHPPRDLEISDSFVAMWPRERLTETDEVELTYRLVEGTPKTLRDVIIRGNAATRDKVIRRKVFQMPGERLDMTKVNKSRSYLEATNFFFKQSTLQGPRAQLLPVPGATDQVDLAVDVEEGETGEFRWGIGFSTGAGVQGTFQFTKRNFDLFNLPSTGNPITAIGEVLENRAFHGGGQTLDLTLMPGTNISQFQIGFTEPDLFGQHFDTWEFRTTGRRRIRRYRDGGYTTDTLGADLGLSRFLSEHFSVGVNIRQESVEVRDLAADAPVTAFDAEGQTELRGLRLTARLLDHDNLRRPTRGYDLTLMGEMLGGFLGGEEDMTKVRLHGNLYVPLMENRAGHWHVLRLQQTFGVASAFGGSNDVYLTERFYMGGADLRGFNFRGAGPSQFGRAVGGEAVYNASLELSMPLVATRNERQIRDSELLRLVFFSDFGLLGLSASDATFHEPRLSAGIGLRIVIPGIEIPLVLDVGWPLLYEESDNRRQLYWSFGR